MSSEVVTAVWVDRNQARIFRISTTHASHEDVQTTGDAGAFYREIARRLANAEQVIVFGPGMAKHHLRYCLIEHYPLIAKRVFGFEGMDQLLEDQILTTARRRISDKN